MPSVLNTGAINSLTREYDLENTSVAGLAGGGHVAVWSKDGVIWSRIYGPNNAVVYAQMFVAGDATQNETPAVVGLDDGSFIVAWRGNHPNFAADAIYGRHFAADGTALNAPVILSDYTLAPTAPSTVELTAAGTNFMVAFDNDQLSARVSYLTFNSEGLFLANNAFVPGPQYFAEGLRIASGDDNRFAAVSYGAASGGGNYRVYLDIGASNIGTTDFTINSTLARIQVSDDASGLTIQGTDIARLEDGSFLVTWCQNSNVYVRQVGSDGTFLTDATQITNGGNATQVKVAALSDGGFQLAWNVYNGNGTIAIEGQRFDANAYALSPVSVLVNQHAAGVDYISDLSPLDNGGFVIGGAYQDLVFSARILMAKAFYDAPSLNGSQLVYGTNDPDLLDGGSGGDKMYGGYGDDTYVINSYGDVVSDTGGYDTVMMGVNYAIGADVELVIMTGHSGLEVDGNNNGNRVYGNDGNNAIFTGNGSDVISGGDGDDYIAVSDGYDRVDGGNGDDFIYGYFGTKTFNGGDGNDYLLGGVSNDFLSGGNQNDVIYLSLGRDQVDGGAGNDTLDGTYVTEAINVSLLVNRAWIGGGASSFLTSIENLKGTDGNDVLQGDNGNNLLDGGLGSDRMSGGAGDDTYVVGSSFDQVSEVLGGVDQGGYDTIQSYGSWTISANIEELELIGGDDVNALGDGRSNVLIGNYANNILNGAGGNDFMYGGDGDDTYVVDSTTDVASEEYLAPSVNTGGTDSVISYTNDYTLGRFIENLTVLFAGPGNGLGTGNNIDNRLTGTSGGQTLNGLGGNDYLDGLTGDDILRGGTGDDTYIVDTLLDTVTEDGDTLVDGIDTVRSSVNFFLGVGLENLTLTGTAIRGFGNASNNTILGNNSANILWGSDGNDRVDGAGGADQMFGGSGNDTYVVNAGGDQVFEDRAPDSDPAIDLGGIDTVESALANYTLGGLLENLTLLTGGQNGTGNASDNTMTGNGSGNILRGLGGADTLNGAGGNDFMFGGGGNDTYYVDSIGDTVSETASGGTDEGGNDTVYSSASITLLSNFVENLFMTGSALSATGNGLNNTIVGTDGQNFITGGLGADTITTGAGADVVIFGVPNTFSRDTITDFSLGVDVLAFTAADYGSYGFTAGVALTSAQFRIGNASVGTNAQFFYNPNNDTLYFDINGSGVLGVYQVAVFTNDPLLSSGSIMII